MTEAQQLAGQLSVSVREELAQFGSYLAVIVGNNPHGSIGAILERADVTAELDSTLGEAQDEAEAAVRQAWLDHGGPVSDPVLEHLAADARRAYDANHLRRLVRAAFVSVPTRQFIVGVTEPGTNPVMESAQERAVAVQGAVEQFARQAVFRNGLSIDVAAGNARTEFLLQQAQDSGEPVLKRWRAHIERPTCCHWCRNLDGRTIGLHEDFAPYLGPPVDLSGHGNMTVPPRPYRGRLPGPKLHPHCQCWLEIVPASVSPPGGQEPSPPVPAGYLAAADIRAMPEPRYQALLAFLRAATHELGQLVRRLARHVRRHP